MEEGSSGHNEENHRPTGTQFLGLGPDPDIGPLLGPFLKCPKWPSNVLKLNETLLIDLIRTIIDKTGHTQRAFE